MRKKKQSSKISCYSPFSCNTNRFTVPTFVERGHTLRTGGSSPPLGDVVLSQNQLSLAGGTTLDLSDIKWGILEPAMVAGAIKRSASMDQQHHHQADQERLNIQEEL